MAENYVNYQVALVPENAQVIDQINSILINGYTSVSLDKVDTSTTNTTTTDKITFDELKLAAKEAKKSHGDDFAMAVIKGNGVELAATLGRSMAKIPEDKYDVIVAAWKAGPKEDDGLGEDDDDGFGDDTPAKVDSEAVKIALKAYAKEYSREDAKKIMTDNGAKALSNVDNCTSEQLAAMMKAMV